MKQKPAKPLRLTKSETTVSYEKTVNEIQKHLIKAGAKKIVFDYDDAQLPCNLTFAYPTKQGNWLFSLPLRFNGVNTILIKQKVSFRSGDLQPINTAWRIMKDWIVAQLAIVDAQMAELPEVFLPYAVTTSGETLYDKMKDGSDMLLLNQ